MFKYVVLVAALEVNGTGAVDQRFDRVGDDPDGEPLGHHGSARSPSVDAASPYHRPVEVAPRAVTSGILEVSVDDAWAERQAARIQRWDLVNMRKVRAHEVILDEPVDSEDLKTNVPRAGHTRKQRLSLAHTHPHADGTWEARQGERMHWWEWSHKAETRTRQSPERFITFEQDCGGLNNIRMQFEFAIAMAFVLGRTLVLPAPTAWPHMDYKDGPLEDLPFREQATTITDLGDFWDLNALRHAGLRVLSAQEFTKEATLLGRAPKVVPLLLDAIKVSYAWPNVQAVHEAGVARSVHDERTLAEMDPEQLNSEVLHLAARCYGKNIFRNLNQPAGIFTFSRKADYDNFRVFFRRNVRYNARIVELATKVVVRLGLFGYAAAHIRRNDFGTSAYPGTALTAQFAADHMDPLLKSDEVLYIASDETDAAWFEPMGKKRKVVRWSDIGPDVPGSPIQGEVFAPKIVAAVEQMICAGARIFFGTYRSTYTGYIFRMRLSMLTPDQRERLVSGALPSESGSADIDLNPTDPKQAYLDFWHESPFFWMPSPQDVPPEMMGNTSSLGEVEDLSEARSERHLRSDS